jgi:hypothetical protein
MAAWIKPTNSLSPYYAGGFTNLLQIAGSSYVYEKTNRVLALTNGVVVFSGGNLALPVTNQVLLAGTDQFINQGANPMAVTLNTSNGLLKECAEEKSCAICDECSGWGLRYYAVWLENDPSNEPVDTGYRGAKGVRVTGRASSPDGDRQCLTS